MAFRRSFASWMVVAGVGLAACGGQETSEPVGSRGTGGRAPADHDPDRDDDGLDFDEDCDDDDASIGAQHARSCVAECGNGNTTCADGIWTLCACDGPLRAGCTNRRRDGDESDVDCGGTDCPACAEGQSCGSRLDCASRVCRDDICVASGCTDGTKNGAETDQDCGGPDCVPCNAGRACEQPSDCTSGVCTTRVCQSANCGDGAKNGAETGTDCGGPCDPCANGEPCAGPQDCRSATCNQGLCVDPTCTDKLQGPGETDVDCGGSGCAPCELGRQCKTAEDCVTLACNGGRCTAPSCGDKRKNGTETGTDCGGSCPACANGGGCHDPDDCTSGYCTGMVCGPCTSATQCSAGEACASGKCGTCTSAAQCRAGEGCVGDRCGACTTSAQCGGGKVCNAGTCQSGSTQTLYQCPPRQSVGGGAWGFYGCHGQLSSNATCTIIEYPTSRRFDCAPQGKLTITASSEPAPSGTKQVALYDCPPQQSLGGGSWAYYECQDQLSTQPTCKVIEFPNSREFNCAPVGVMTLHTSPPAAPSGGKVVQMYQCPESGNLGGGSWGYYECQGQLTNTPSCNVTEYPTTRDFPCTAAGWLVLEP